MTDFSTCQLYDSHKPTCGDFTFKKCYGLFILGSLTEDVSNSIDFHKKIFEFNLIQNRCASTLSLDKPICSKHRFTFGVNYRPPSSCSFPNHNCNQKAYTISPHTYDNVVKIFPSYIIKNLICKKCIQIIETESHSVSNTSRIPISIARSLPKRKAKQSAKASIAAVASTVNIEYFDDSLDDDYVPSYVPHDNDNEKKTVLDQICKLLNVMPLKYTIHSNVNELADSTISFHRKIFRKIQEQISDLYFESVAPGQEQDLKQVMFPEKNEDKDKVQLTEYLRLYGLCTNNEARANILSLIPNTHSKLKVSELFGVSEHQVTIARKRLNTCGPAYIPPRAPIVRNCLDMEKAKHFVDFLRNGILLEEAYGTTVIKYDCGVKRIVTNSILLGVKEHVIKEYQLYCVDINQATLSHSSLKKILDCMSPKTRKRVVCADIYLVNGYNAFEVL